VENYPRVASIDLGATCLRTVFWSASAPDFIQRFATTTAEQCEKICDSLLDRMTTEISSLTKEIYRSGSLYISMSRAPDLSHQGVILDWPRKPDWIGQPVLSPQFLSQKNIHFRHFDDGQCAAAWEYLASNAAPSDNILVLSFGTGLAVGHVLHSMVQSTGNGGQSLSHMLSTSQRIRCVCGQQGCLQAVLYHPDLTPEEKDHHLAQALHQLDPDHYITKVIITGGQANQFRYLQSAGNREFILSQMPKYAALAGAAALALWGNDLRSIPQGWIEYMTYQLENMKQQEINDDSYYS